MAQSIFQALCQRLIGAVAWFRKTFFTLSLPCYFFWSLLIYVLAGAFCLYMMYGGGMMNGGVHPHLCAKPFDTTTSPSCKNCTESILTCGKSTCLKTAFGLMKNFTGVGEKLEDELIDATLDIGCNTAVLRAANVPSMLLDMIKKKKQKKVKQPCVDLHCQTML